MADPTPPDPVQAELWSTEAPQAPAPHVSMPLGTYRVERQPGQVLPGPGQPDESEGSTVTREHIACKQPVKPVQAALVG